MLLGTHIWARLYDSMERCYVVITHMRPFFLDGSQHRAWGQLAAAAARRRQHVKAGATPVGERSTIGFSRLRYCDQPGIGRLAHIRNGWQEQQWLLLHYYYIPPAVLVKKPQHVEGKKSDSLNTWKRRDPMRQILLQA